MILRRRMCALRSLKLGVISSLVAVAVPFGSVTRGDEDAGAAAVDCGTLALGALLLLEGHPMEPDILLAHLRPSSPAGSSLEELRTAAGACVI